MNSKPGINHLNFQIIYLYLQQYLYIYLSVYQLALALRPIESSSYLNTVEASLSPRPLIFTTTFVPLGKVGQSLSRNANAWEASNAGKIPSSLHTLLYAARESVTKLINN